MGQHEINKDGAQGDIQNGADAEALSEKDGNTDGGGADNDGSGTVGNAESLSHTLL